MKSLRRITVVDHTWYTISTTESLDTLDSDSSFIEAHYRQPVMGVSSSNVQTVRKVSVVFAVQEHSALQGSLPRLQRDNNVTY
jgi:hypothetical protein